MRGKILKKKDRENGHFFVSLFRVFFEIVLTVLSEKRRIYFEKYRNRYSDLSRIDAPFQWKDKSNGNIPFLWQFLPCWLSPSLVLSFWRKDGNFQSSIFLVGLIGFALPVMMIEGPINALVLSSFGHSSKWFTIIYGGLMAGLVEETTRYLDF